MENNGFVETVGHPASCCFKLLNVALSNQPLCLLFTVDLFPLESSLHDVNSYKWEIRSGTER
jgi:hypothetical protein